MIGAICALMLMAAGGETGAHPQVRIVGSTTIAPFSQEVAARLVDRIDISVVQTGTSQGLASLCPGDQHMIAAASRRIRADELARCRDAGVGSLVEIGIGLDGIVVAQSVRAPAIALNTRDMYLALARRTPASENDCLLVTNRRVFWSDVRPDLPKRKITVIGPPASSGTRSVFSDLVMADGARHFPCLADAETASPTKFAEAITLRRDGAWVDGGESDHVIAHTLSYVSHALGIFGFAHVAETATVEAIPLNGVTPSATSISDGSYALRRGLYLYATSATVAEHADVNQVLGAFTDLRAVGPDGSLRRLGLILPPSGPTRRIIETGQVVVPNAVDATK